MRYGRQANYRNLIVFGCDAYPLTPKVQRSKLDPTSKKCIFLGYQTSVKDYLLYDSVARKLIVSRDVSFNQPRLLKEGEKARAPLIDNVESPLNTVEGEIGYDSFHDAEGEVPIEEVVPNLEEHVEQEGVGVP